MQEISNIAKLKEILMKNGGYITRRQVDENGIPSWFLTNLVRKEKLEKIAWGFYATEDWMQDDFFVFQYTYSKFVFSYDSALYLLGMTDKLPQGFEVTDPKNYRPFNPRDKNVIVHTDYKQKTYELGIAKVCTSMGHEVLAYDAEKTICSLIARAERIESETYVKALRSYAKFEGHTPNKLMEYAKVMGIEKKVYETMMVVLNGQ